MKKYSDGLATDEDDITPGLLGNLDAEFKETIGSIKWSSSVLRHRRGIASEEKQLGADLIIHVSLETSAHSYSKGVFVQAKRNESGQKMTKAERAELTGQCQSMAKVTASAFIFNYTKQSMRVGSVSKIGGSNVMDLYSNCDWTSYRFFLELFRCPIGDSRIYSASSKAYLEPSIILLSGKESDSIRRSRLR